MKKNPARIKKNPGTTWFFNLPTFSQGAGSGERGGLYKYPIDGQFITDSQSAGNLSQTWQTTSGNARELPRQTVS